MKDKIKKGYKSDKICEKIKEWQKDPDFLRAAREFIRLTTS